MEISNTLSIEERLSQVKAKVQLLRDKANKAQDLVVQEWLNASRRCMIKDQDAKMLEEKHFAEAIDPLHRYGTNLWLFQEEWEKSKSSQGFFEWLDRGDGRGRDVQNCEWRILNEQRVCYLHKPVQREALEVTARDGKLYYKKSGNAVETKVGEQWIYVLSPSRELYIGKKEKGFFHHSTFLAGAPVLAAGFIQVSDGTIKGLDWSSGHYIPSKGNFQRLIRFFEEKQLDVSQVPCSQRIKGMNFV